jgi:RNA polymerase sigma-70 factor, ECF subfamily
MYGTNEKENIEDNNAKRELSELVLRSKQGDKHAFSQIFEHFKDKLFSFIYNIIGNRDEALDIVSESFYRAYKSLSSYDNRTQFSTWLYSIASNLAISYLRKRRFIELPQSLLESVPSLADNPDEEHRQEQIEALLDYAKRKLSPRERAVFAARFQEQRSIREITEILHIEEGTVKNLYHRAMKKIYIIFKKYGQDLYEKE